MPESRDRGVGAIDPITMEVLGNAVLSICDEMHIVLGSTARSPVLRESGDMACTLHDAAGQLVAQSNTLPALASLARHAVLRLREMVGKTRRVDPGDIFFTNHLNVGGSHLSDVKAIAPVFHDGEIVAWVANCAHWPDVGGAFAGGYVCATEIYQEGLLIPPVRLYRNGELDGESVAFVLENVRSPDERLGDIRAQAAAVHRGQARIRELIAKYGVDHVRRFFSAYIDYTEKRVRHEIRGIPNGVYGFADQMDNDGITETPVGIKVQVTVRDDSIVCDFTGSDPQVQGPINATPWTVWAGVNFAIRGVTDPRIPINEGVYRPLELIIPEGTWLNARHPAPRQHSTHETGHRVIDVVLGALAKAVPDRVPAAMHGTSSIMIMAGSADPNDRSKIYFLYECLAGGFGARPTKDGIDGMRTGVGNATNVPVEVLEVEYPLVTDHYELACDTGGAGLHRGGCGLSRTIRILGDDATKVLCVSSSERIVTRPYGLAGGKPAASGRWVINAGRQGEEALRGKRHRWLHGGETFSATAPGGGGWGDPLQRDPERVLEDVLDEKVSLEGARRDYGVVIDPVRLIVDPAATARLRKHARA
jgi:N-methylhydantoinase B